MYLKNIEVKNYRKFGEEQSLAVIAHSNESSSNLIESISKNTSLFIGKNNSGKTSILELIHRLSNIKAGAKGDFTINDINISYMRDIYNEYLVGDKKIGEGSKLFPTFKVELTIGLEDLEDNVLTAFEEILYIHEIESIARAFSKADETDDDQQKQTEITFTAVFEPNKENELTENIKKLKNEIDNELFDTFLKKVVNKSDVNFEEEFNTKTIQKILKSNTSLNGEEQQLIKFCKNYYFRKYLNTLEDGDYIINVYTKGSEAPVKEFSFSTLFEIKKINANNITDNNSLTKAYNKIIHNIIKLDNDSIMNKIDGINYSVESGMSEQVEVLNRAVIEIENPRNMQMDLMSDINLEKILKHAIVYNYVEEENYIPENQFGLGYTNLMMIIAELTDFFHSYEEDNVNSKINLIIIEEPESFMHPQMQELFIKHVESAVNVLKDNSGLELDFKYQLLISTHSSHILNSKVHTGNSFDNINYLTSAINNNSKIVCLSDNSVSGGKEDDESLKSLEFIKKHIQLETSDLFFSDAVILVEGVTEEVLLKYLINKNESLYNYHIKVFRITGSHMQVYIQLLKKLQIPVVIFSDMDYKRKNYPKNESFSYQDYEEYNLNTLTDEILDIEVTSNKIIEKYFIESSNDKITALNESLLDKKDNQFFKKAINHHISIFTQGKINGYYATSFEEAFILQNSDESDATVYSNLRFILEEVYPNIFKKALDFIESEEIELSKISYYLQSKFKSGNKTNFINTILEKSITNNEFKINHPVYIEKGLSWIESQLEGEEK